MTDDFKLASLADLNSHHIEGFAVHGNTPFSVPLYSNIIGNLWTGGCPVKIAPIEFQFIVSLYPWGQYERHAHQVYLEARLYDSEQMGASKLLHALAEYVNSCVEIGPTLVHCQAGLNRSALIAALSLIKKGWSPDEAIKTMREKRCSAALCNQAFEKWLRGQA